MLLWQYDNDIEIVKLFTSIIAKVFPTEYIFDMRNCRDVALGEAGLYKTV